MDSLIVEIAAAVDAERLRQARAARPGRRPRAGARAQRRDSRHTGANPKEQYL